MRRSHAWRAVAPGALLLISLGQGRALAQGTLTDTLSFLVTNQAVPTGDFVKDRQSAQITQDTIARLLLVDLTTLPLSASSGGFAYRFNPAVGTVERASDSFGPFFTERSLTIGSGQVSLGGQVQLARYTQLDAYDLRDGSFVITANRFRDESRPFDVEALTLELDSATVTLFGNVGVLDRLDLGVAIPLIWISLEGSRVNQYRGATFLQARAVADARGFGDVALRGKVNLLGERGSGLAVIEEVRLPTGREEDLLGSGEMSFRTLVIGSAEPPGRIAVHGNFGFTLGGLFSETSYRGAVTLSALPQLTVIGEILGRRIADVGSLAEEQAPHPSIAGVVTTRLVTTGESVNTATFVAGMKWNVTDTWLLHFNVSMPLTQRGLRSDIVTLVGLDYSFSQ
jgi:hypothetical protein